MTALDLDVIKAVLIEKDAADTAMKDRHSDLYTDDQDAYKALFDRKHAADTAFRSVAADRLPALVAEVERLQGVLNEIGNRRDQEDGSYSRPVWIDDILAREGFVRETADTSTGEPR